VLRPLLPLLPLLLPPLLPAEQADTTEEVVSESRAESADSVGAVEMIAVASHRAANGTADVDVLLLHFQG
jgi:hypothetical protein